MKDAHAPARCLYPPLGPAPGRGASPPDVLAPSQRIYGGCVSRCDFHYGNGSGNEQIMRFTTAARRAPRGRPCPARGPGRARPCRRRARRRARPWRRTRAP